MLQQKKRNCGETCSTFLTSCIYSMGVCMLENNTCHVIFYCMILLYELMGQLFFPFLVGLDVEGEGKDLESIYKTLRYIDLDYYLEGVSFEITMALLIILVAFALIILIHTLLLHREAKLTLKNESIKFALPLIINKIISLFLLLISTVLTIPIYTVLISTFVCHQQDETYVFTNSPDVDCYTGLHLTFTILASMLLIFFTLVNMLIPIFTDTFPSSKIPWAGPQIYKILYTKFLTKLTIVAFNVFGHYERTYSYSLFFVFIFVFFTFYIILVSATYLNQLTSWTVQFTQGFLLFYVLAIYAKRVSELELNTIGVFLLFAVSSFMGVLTIFGKDHYRNYLMDFDIKGTKNENKIEYYLYEISRELQNYLSGELYHQFDLPGLLSSHQLRCMDEDCNCHTYSYNRLLSSNRVYGSKMDNNPFSSRMSSGMAGNLFEMKSQLSHSDLIGIGKNDESDAEEELMTNKEANIQCIIQFVDTLVQNELRKSPRSVSIRLISAYSAKHFLNNLFKAIFQARNIQEILDPGFKDSFIIHRYTKYIDNEIKFITARIFGENDIDISKILIFDAYYDEIRLEIEDCSNTAYQFWDHLSSTNFEVDEIYQMGAKINNIYNLIKERYEKAHELFMKNATLIGDMSRFEYQIMNNSKAGNILFLEVQNIIREQSEQFNTKGEEGALSLKENSQNLCIVTISGNPGSFGQILSTNDKILKTFGQMKKKVVGNNLDILIPKYMEGLHDEFLLNFIDRGRSKIIGKRQILIAQDNKGFLITIRIIVKLVPSINEGIKFLSFICKLESPNPYFKEGGLSQNQMYFTNEDFAFIVCDKDDQIIGINEVCLDRLGIPLNIFTKASSEDEPLKIHNIFPELLGLELEETDLATGKTVFADTRFLKLNPNREILSKREMKLLNEHSGKHKVFLKYEEEKITPQLIVGIYRMIILSEGAYIRIGTKDMGMGERSSKLSLSATEGEITSKGMSEEIASLSSNNSLAKITFEMEPDQAEESEMILKVQALKEKLGTKTTTFSTSILSKILPILLLLVFILSTICFGLFYSQTNTQAEGAEICYKASTRWYLSTMVTTLIAEILLESHQYLVQTPSITDLTETEMESEIESESEYEVYMEYMERESKRVISAGKIPGVNKLEYFKDLCKIGIKGLIDSQNYLYSEEFENENIHSLEKGKEALEVVGLNSKREQIIYRQSINTFITQYTAKALAILSLPSPQIAQIYILTPTPSNVEINYYFLKENLFRNAPQMHESFELFLKYYKNENENNEIYIAVLCLIAIIIIFLSMLIIFPNIIIMEQNKNKILTLYAYVSLDEAKELARKCLDYQKNEGFSDINEAKTTTEDSLLCDPDLDETQISLVGILKARTMAFRLRQKSENERTLGKIEEGIESEGSDPSEEEEFLSQSWSCTQETKNLDYDNLQDSNLEIERQRIIDEILKREKMINRLKINRLLVLFILLILALSLASYFSVLIYYNQDLIKVADDYLILLPFVTQYFCNPHLLMLYLTTSIRENRKIYIHGEHESVEHLLKAITENLDWRSDFVFEELQYSEHTQEEFNVMDKVDNFCNIFLKMRLILEDHYLEELDLSEIRKVGKNECNEYQNGILKRGVNNLEIMFYQLARRMQAERESAIDAGISPFPIVNISNFILAGSIFDAFIFPVGYHLLEEPEEDLVKYLYNHRLYFSYGYAAYLFLILFFYFILWRKYLNLLVESVYRMKGLLKIMPQELLLTVCQMKIKHELRKEGKDPEDFNLEDHIERIYKIIS